MPDDNPVSLHGLGFDFGQSTPRDRHQSRNETIHLSRSPLPNPIPPTGKTP